MITYQILINGVIAGSASLPHRDAAETWADEFSDDALEDGTVSEDDTIELVEVR